jgi:hypothetical protein
MAWLWLLFPLLILALTLLVWRAVATLRRERADLQSEVAALRPLAAQARQDPQPDTPRPATGREQVDR